MSSAAGQALPHVLVINPNTSDSVTQRLQQQLSHAWPAAQIHAVSAPFGAPYIVDEYSYCVAGHAVLQAWQMAQAAAPAQGYAAVLIACFGDPGREALAEVAPVPVWGLAQAAMAALQAQGNRRVGVVTGGEKWMAMLQRWSRAQGWTDAQSALEITQIEVLPATGIEMMQSPKRTVQALHQLSAAMLQSGQVDVVLLGGAGLVGMGEQVRAMGLQPVWDCVEAAQQCLQHALCGTNDLK